MQDFVNWFHSNKSVTLKNTIRIMGAYGIIQVFAQDVGIPSNRVQMIIVRNLYIQFVLFTAVAYSVTDDFFQSLSGTITYFVLRYANESSKDILLTNIKNKIIV
jgi:hypothetical protein